MSCGVLKSEMFLGADGTVCPCMSMVDAKAESWPNAFETPLRDILGESPFMDRCATSVGMVRDGNDACRACEYIDRCNGGCRAGALMSSGNYLAPCPENCHFFSGGWYERFQEVGQRALEQYLAAHPEPLEWYGQGSFGKSTITVRECL